jgi:primary-amine oxidase
MAQVLVRDALAPLSGDEISEATRILREARGLPSRHRFIQVSLREPDKAQVLAGAQTEREAFIILLDHDQRTTFEAVISLTRGTLLSWQAIEDVQPPIALEEFAEAE